MSQIKNTPSNYGMIAKIFHWGMAVLIIGLLISGLYMVELPLSLKRLKWYGWHKEFGIFVLFLVILRLIWRISNIVPALPSNLPSWQKLAAHIVHFALYVFMLAMPITGWVIASAAGLPVSFFGWFVLPDLVSPNENLRILFSEIHAWLGYGLIGLLLAHGGAALLHHFIYKDNVLRRMLWGVKNEK